MLIGLFVRVFGLSSWSVLLPEAIAGIGTVIVLIAANGLATVARFVLLRTWISARPSHSTTYDQLQGSPS